MSHDWIWRSKAIVHPFHRWITPLVFTTTHTHTLVFYNMSAKLPFQKKAGFRPQFNRNNKFGFGDDDEDHDEQDQVSMVTGFEDNKLQE